MASHHSALVVRGLPAFNADLLQAHLTRCADDRSRKRKGLTVHQQIIGAEPEDGVIAAALAVVQAGCVNGPMAALVAADAALHTGVVTPDDLVGAGRQLRTAPSFAVRRILTSADGRAESPGETRLRHAVQMMGFAVIPQVPLDRWRHRRPGRPAARRRPGGARVRRLRHVLPGSAPQRVAHAGGHRRGGEVPRGPGAELGYEVVRVTWSELSDQPALRRRIEAAVARTGRRGVVVEARARL